MKCFIAALILLPGLVWGSVYYVATDGDNGNPGTISEPWRTINYAIGGSSALARGDTVYVMGGYYRADGTVNPGIASSGQDSICIMAYPGQTVHSPAWDFTDGDDYYYVREMQIDSMDAAGGVRLKGADHITFELCSMSYNNNAGLITNNVATDTTVEYLKIIHCNLNFNGQDVSDDQKSGMSFFAWNMSYFYIFGNNINCNGVGGEGKGITFAMAGIPIAEGCTFDSNNVIANTESGCDFKGMTNSKIRWNYISLNGVNDPEAGDFGDKGLMLTQSCTSCSVYQNIIKSCGRQEVTFGGDKIFFCNNLVKADTLFALWPDTTYGGKAAFTVYDGLDNDSITIKNNIFMNSIMDSAKWYCWLYEDYNDYNLLVDSDYNCLYNDYTAKTVYMGGGCPYQVACPLDTMQAHGDEPHSIYADPLFISEADSNFNLQFGSPCIDAGVDVGLPYQGDAPDIGVFESNYAGSSPGTQVIIIENE